MKKVKLFLPHDEGDYRPRPMPDSSEMKAQDSAVIWPSPLEIEKEIPRRKYHGPYIWGPAYILDPIIKDDDQYAYLECPNCGHMVRK